MDRVSEQGTPSHPDPASARLVAALRAGEPAAFEALIRGYGGRLLAACRRLLPNEDDARDCVQDTFLQAFRHIAQFEGRADLGTWLYRIAINQALMRLRAAAGGQEAAIDDLLPQFDGHGARAVEPVWNFAESVEDALARQKTRELVLAKIAELPEGYRSVLILRDVEELSTREVGERLGLTESTVKVRLHRARAALKRLLEPLWQGGYA